MSGPYRYQPDASRSPLDRHHPQNPLPAQPVSFKTNVNRAKTKKWVEAKKNAYDGDDWGDYDEYDEYGAADQEPPPSQPAVHARGYGQRLEQPGRSFTDPQKHIPPTRIARRNSFETGEEQRAFSASTGHPPNRQGASAHPEGSDALQHQRNFSPPAMPPPLNTRMSPAPAGTAASPSTRFPPRKSSIGQVEAPPVVSPRERAPSNPGKPLPFIRPADIYKRFEEEKKERDRLSLDGQRPGAEVTSQQSLADAQPPSSPPTKETMPSLNSDLRSVVDHAFTRADDQRSVPPTPVTKSDSSVSRSNTSSTSGISPIMSRVPSSTTSALKARNAAGGDGSTPVITEEASESSTPVSRPNSAAMLGGSHHISSKPLPNHSRNASGSSLPGSGLITPNASGSPARSPVVTPQSHVPEAGRAEFLPLSRSPGETKSLADATVREADIAKAMRTRPDNALPELSAAEKESQTSFLENHQTPTPVFGDTGTRSRSESPSKGRVQELAGKFGDVSHSRRGSTQSNASHTSVQSWEKSGGDSRPVSPAKPDSPSRDALGVRPLAERESSFRPQLPGQWESYATSAASPTKELGTDDIIGKTDQVSSPLEKVDLEPTTVKRSVVSTDPPKPDSSSAAHPLTDSLAALKAAGAAVGEAVQSSVGLIVAPTDEAHREHTHGDVLPRPLRSYRVESSASSIPPTPPPKDVTGFVELPPPPPLKEKNHDPQSTASSGSPPERPVMLPQLSTDMTDDDQESDRLRKEIVASLSPQPTALSSAVAQDPAAPSISHGQVGRESALFPSEYDSYWADGDRTVSRSSHDRIQNDKPQERQGADALLTSESLTQSPDSDTKPSILTRFSWEQGGGSGLSPSELQSPTIAIATKPEDVERKHTEEDIPTLPMNERAAEEQGITDPSHSHSGLSPGVSDIEHESTSAVNLRGHSLTMDQTNLVLSQSELELDQTPSPATGLHVVNSALHPEAVDLPPRLSREASPLSDHARPTEHTPIETAVVVNHDTSSRSAFEPAISDPLYNAGETANISSAVAVSPASDRPLGFRDILQFKSPSERVSNYNKTRDYWAHADHGLSNWINTALEKNPDLVTQPYPQPPPHLNTTGTIRHKATSSISLFGKHHGSGSVQAEPPSASAQSPITPTSGPTIQGSGRSAGHQMQAKGKDLLHTAGVLSGKGMTGAKGLFAKGKSRFKSEKAISEQGRSSREASEEPAEKPSATNSAGSDTPARMSLETVDNPKESREMKHIRRFSSPFHRSSRSRSRPTSIILPSTESTPRSTPAHSRPQSYYPPETWGAGPSALSATSPVRDMHTPTPERLGVLPSPARSAFSWIVTQGQGQVPSVPPIPDDVDASHRLLQSVIRNSTPPVGEQQDASPVIARVAISPDISVSSDDEQPTPAAPVEARHGEGGYHYETELIGDDISPVSSHMSHNKEKVPAFIHARQVLSNNLDGNSNFVRIVETALSGDQAATHAETVEPASRPKLQPQLSEYRVVHAVEYLHSQSSFESLEQESIATSSQSDQAGQHGDAELPPTLLSPDPESQGLTIDEDLYLLPTGRDKKSDLAIPTKSDTPQDGPQQSPNSAKLATHKRSESLMSKISSMVSADDTSISPVSSGCLPRSRPPSAQARWRQVPSAKTSPIPVQIPKEPNASDRTINSALMNDDFDLYADHDGVVRDLQDEEGQPLRVLTDRPPQPVATLRRSVPDVLKHLPLPTPMEDTASRHSDERPMSFVWGPRDANGRPQDEINRPAGNALDTPLPLPNTRIQRSSQALNGPAAYTKTQISREQSGTRLLGQPSHADPGSKNVSPLSSYRESTKSSLKSTASPLPTSNASISPRKPSSPDSLDAPRLDSPNPPSGDQGPEFLTKFPDLRLPQDSRAMMETEIRKRALDQSLIQDSRSRSQFPSQTPQLPGNMLAAARTQYEYQQMLARQAMQVPEFQSLVSREQPARKEDRPFKPRLSSVFKAFGKSSSSTVQIPQASMQHAPQQIQQPPSRSHPVAGNMTDNVRLNNSHPPGVSDHVLSKTENVNEWKVSGLGSVLHRSPSMDQESQISQESTQVQVTDSRLDLRYTANPQTNQNIVLRQSPQKPFPHDMDPPIPSNYRVSNSQVPETSGKKKRFSALGNIFNRGATSTGLPIRMKLNKGEKKVSKAQKHPNLVPLQLAPQNGSWLLQQSMTPERYVSIQYGLPPMAGPSPGNKDVQSQPVALQGMVQQAAIPFSSQHEQHQSILSSSQQSTPAHTAAQRHEYPPQFQSTLISPRSHLPHGVPEGSAYMDTRQFTQTHAQRMQAQIQPSTQPSSQPLYQDHRSRPPELHPDRQYFEGTASPPVNEFFKPDLKTIKPLPPIRHQQPTQDYRYLSQTHQGQATSGAPRQPPDSSTVLPSSDDPAADPFSYGSQPQMGTLLNEPKYDTPPIPGAYAHVSGAFVSPQFEESLARPESSQPPQTYHQHRSDPKTRSVAPQASAMPTALPNSSIETSDSVVSPLLNPSPAPLPAPSPLPNLNFQKPQISSITEQVQSERPWNLNLPQGATEQEIVRARQRQYMEQQLLAQEQLHAERTGRSPSPRSRQSNQSTSPPPPPPPPPPVEERPPQQEIGGFRELLPRTSPRPYPVTSQQAVERLQAPRPHSPSPPIATAPAHPGLDHSPAIYPLPVSPDLALVTSPVNPMADIMPPPPVPEKSPQAAVTTALPTSRVPRPISQSTASNDTHDSLYDPPPPAPTEQYQRSSRLQQPAYDDIPPTDELPPYSGPGMPNESLEKERSRPPNIVTTASDRGHDSESRQRQASLGLLQHPQPASMAASPQRSSADMGADILRRQLLEAEERERLERLQRAEIQRQESARERKERERARARARELERSVSGGGRVGSLRIAEGSTRANSNGFERSASTARPVYELPAEDDEPVMRATSFPGQEWVPTWTED